MYLQKLSFLFQIFFPSILWRKRKEEGFIYLTFDDGPDPKSTPRLLQILEKGKAKATFFCLGEKAATYPELILEIKKQGHIVGNHGYRHMNGWQTDLTDYLENIEKGYNILKTHLFRPPYGKITLGQYKSLRRKHKIVMWNLMPGDFDPKISAEKVEKRMHRLKQGDIIVLHDSPKTIGKLEHVLPKILEKNKSSAL